jgi:hypothetical protein
MAIKKLHQFFYYHNKYLNSMKCPEISMGPTKCTIQCSTSECTYVVFQIRVHNNPAWAASAFAVNIDKA